MAMRDMRGLNEFIKQIRSTKVRGAARSSTPRARGAKEGGEVHVPAAGAAAQVGARPGSVSGLAMGKPVRMWHA